MLRSPAIFALIGATVFASAQSRPHPYDLRDVKWNVVLDEVRSAVKGDITNTVRPNKGATEVWFDRGELIVTRVTVDGKLVKHRVAGQRLYVPVSASSAGKDVKVRILYHGVPRAGLYFIPAKRGFPATTPVIYTQGEMEDNRFWLVTYDYPDDKATSEGIIDVPSSYFALSNGKLLSTTPRGKRTTYHWKMDQPHVTYLIALVAGPYEKGHETWGGIPIDYYVPKGLMGMGKAAFAGTNDYVRFFSDLTGFKYPYAKFSQAVVPDYMFGGMENITMVTNTIGALYPPSAYPLADARGLVLHELAHQWFGDTVTTTGWGDAWINEGWASFIPSFYVRAKDGQQAFDLARYDTFNGGLGAHKSKPDRAVVFREYKDPLDMFDGFIYAGGASRMFMLMEMLGEEQFWAACQKYLEARKFTSFDTNAFFATWSKVTGRDLTPFMKQWFFTAGAPNLTVKWEGNNVVVSQPKPYFDLELPVWVLNGADWVKKSVHLTGAEARVEVAEAAGKPVLVDPEVWLMGEFDYKYATPLSTQDKIALYDHAPNAAAKARIMDTMLRSLSPAEVLTFAKTLSEQDPLLQRYVGSIQPTPGAEEYLLNLLKSREKQLANSAADRLGGFPTSTSSRAALSTIYKQDSNVLFRQTAVRSLVRSSKDSALLPELWKQDSYNDGYRRFALEMWVDRTPDAGRAKCLEVLATPPSEPVRVDAIRYLGRLKDAPGKKVVFQALLKVLKEDSFGARNTAMSALGEYGDKAAIPYLKPFLQHPLVFFRRTSKDVIARLGG